MQIKRFMQEKEVLQHNFNKYCQDEYLVAGASQPRFLITTLWQSLPDKNLCSKSTTENQGKVWNLFKLDS